ncbi:Ricin-type beta-trefoil lectin domain-like [bacterium A37T11]|nr:Ricin-type beta-trefoil lectin domain-like [bacterium A37T11]
MKRTHLLCSLLLLVACTKELKTPPSPERLIKSFRLASGQYGKAQMTIQEDKSTITVQIYDGLDLKALVPKIEVSEGAIISPASGQPIDVSKNHKFTYTVTAASGLSMEWEVEFVILTIGDYGTYLISDTAQKQYLSVLGDTLYNKKYDDGALVSTLPPGGIQIPRYQKWHLIKKNTVNGVSYYQLRNLHSGKLLTADGNDPNTSIALVQRTSLTAETDRQLWKLDQTSNLGQYTLINKHFSSSVGNLPIQHWMMVPIEADTYRDDDVVRFFNRNESSQGSVAFDQGNSIPLSWGPNNGKILWVTQDAWDGTSLTQDDKFQCGYFFSYGNSMLLQPSAQDWNNVHTPNVTIPGGANGRNRQVCTIQPNNTFAWPGMGVEIGQKIYIHCGEGSGLGATNQSLYVLSENEGTVWEAERTLPAGLSGQVEIIYSSGMVKGADGFVYAFGSETIGFGYQTYLHVARFRQENPQKWSFFDGNSWTDAPIKGAGSKIADGLGTITVSYLQGKFILMTMDQGYNCDASRNVYIATADSPTGPFTNRKLVYTINEYFYGKYTRYYTPAIHPQFDNGRNELLLTYCINYSACGLSECQDGVIDPYYYRVKGIRVPYSIIGL